MTNPRLPLLIAAACLAALVPVRAFALPPIDTWVMESPARTKTPIYDMSVDASGVAWAAGATQLRSAYPGGTWEPVRAGLGANQLVATGGSRTVVMGRNTWEGSRFVDVSNDGGVTWGEVNTGVDFVGMDAVFADENEGWIVGSGGVVLHTTDAGYSWQSQNAGVEGWIQAVDYTEGVLRLVSGGILATSRDAGATWTQTQIEGAWEITDIAFTGAETGFIVSNKGVSRTVDGGVTWTTKFLNYNTEGMRLVFKDALRGWVHGSGNDEYTTSDGGLTWTKQYTTWDYRDRFGASITKPYIAGGWWTRGSSVGWRFASNGGVFFSVDSGKTWYSTAVNSFTLDDLADLSFETSNTGIAVTRKGRIFKTTDSGGTWSLCQREYPVSAGGSQVLHSVVKVRGGRGFAAGNDTYRAPGVIYRSDTAGSSWYAVRPPVKDTINDVWTNDGVRVWAVGAKGSMVRSTNGGDSWSVMGSTVTSGTEMREIKVLPDGRGYAVGTNKVLRTTDNGLTWKATSLPSDTDLTSLDVAPDGTPWVGSTRGRVFRSLDDGATWEGDRLIVDSNTDEGEETDHVTSLSAESSVSAMATRNGQLFSAEDGLTWIGRPLHSGVILNGVSVLGDGMWACGDDGHVFFNAHGHPELLPPATQIGVPTGWRRQVIDLNMFAVDPDGIDETLYRIDATDTALPVFTASAVTWSRFTKPKRITKQGKTKVEYLSSDKRGNVERKKTRYLYLDTGLPSISFTAKSSYARYSKITVKAADSVSGVRKIVIVISTPDNGYQKTYYSTKATYTLSRRGTWLLDITATDYAGNTKSYMKKIRVY